MFYFCEINNKRRHIWSWHINQQNEQTFIHDIFQDWGITQIAFEQDTEPIWFERDKTVKDFCEEGHIEYVEEIGHTLWDPRE